MNRRRMMLWMTLLTIAIVVLVIMVFDPLAFGMRR